jgi:L-histidine N-alpha-methyltransferase
VLAGLARPQKRLPAKYFYDAAGSRLFDRICELPEYYPTRTELGILRRHAPAMAERCGPDCLLVELGAGSLTKVRLLLDHLERPAGYVPVDVSGEYLRAAAVPLAEDYPTLNVVPVVADFTRPFALPSVPAARRVAFFPGSTIGNFEPGPAQDFLRRAHDLLGAGGAVLLGVDLRKPKAILDLAYNDPEGYTAQFNLNLLLRLNRELGAQFDLSAFAHRAFYNEAASRIEMHLVSRRAQSVRVAGQLVQFAADETIHTENSYKYTSEQVQQMARAAGFDGVRAWTDPLGWFGVFLLSGAERAGNAR